MKKIELNRYSQEHVLQERMAQKGLKHGDTVTATLSPVRLERNPTTNEIVMYFCPLQDINIKEVISHGDGGHLPEKAILKGFENPSAFRTGLYIIENVQLFSNGTLQVIETEKTVIKEYRDDFYDRNEPLMRHQLLEQSERERRHLNADHREFIDRERQFRQEHERTESRDFAEYMRNRTTVIEQLRSIRPSSLPF